MSSQHAGRFIFLVLFSLLPICSEIVSAQNKVPEQISADEIPAETVAVQPKYIFGKTPTELEKPAFIIRETPAQLKRFDKAETKSATADFRPIDRRDWHIGFERPATRDEKFSFRPLRPVADAPDDTKNLTTDETFRWGSATKQTLMFLAIQHGYAFTQPKTREAIKGKFWKDYVKSVKSLHGWADGGRFFTNYVAHPMQGAFLGYVQIQNDPKGLKQQFAQSPDYWRSRLKAMAWSAAWSTQFEIGPVSQASIGNVGLKGKQTYIDIVVTPTVGTAWLITEDAIDRFVTKRIERGTDSFYVRIFSRMLLSPTRTIANLFRFKTPWYRDRPIAR